MQVLARDFAVPAREVVGPLSAWPCMQMDAGTCIWKLTWFPDLVLVLVLDFSSDLGLRLGIGLGLAWLGYWG